MAQRHPYQRGDVVLVQFPFSNASGTKDRPAVVLSTSIYHDNWDDLLVVAITSRWPKTSRPSDYELQDWRAAGLSLPSWVRSKVATIHRAVISRKLGQLSNRDFFAVENCLRIATGL